MDMTGSPDGDPTRVGVAITDYLAGLYASQGILLALLDRKSSGRGQHGHRAVRRDVVGHAIAARRALAGGDPTRVGNDHLSIAPTSRCAPATDSSFCRREPAAVDPVLRGDRAAGSSRRSAVQDERRPRREPRRAQGSDRGVFQHFTVEEFTARLEAASVPAGVSVPCAKRSSIPR